MLNTIKNIIKFYLFDNFINFTGTNTPKFDRIPLQLNYDSYWKFRVRDIKKIPKKLSLREKIVFSLIKPKTKVMDFGCGFSPLLKYLKKNEHNVMGFDISEIAVRFQNKNKIRSILIKDKNYLRFGSFDYIILTEVLEHIVNPEGLIFELKGKTKYFIIAIPNSAYFAYRLKLFFRGRISMQWMYHPSEHLRYWSHVEFIEWANALGLKLIKYQCVRGILSSVNVWPNLLSCDVVYLFKTG